MRIYCSLGFAHKSFTARMVSVLSFPRNSGGGKTNKNSSVLGEARVVPHRGSQPCGTVSPFLRKEQGQAWGS